LIQQDFGQLGRCRRDDVRLGDGLALANGHRPVAVGERLAVRRDKPVSLHFTHCLQYAQVSDDNPRQLRELLQW